jgi:hypothetical protein
LIGYVYKTSYGTFSIFPDATGRWRLEMNGQYASAHASAAAADSVFGCASGHIDWDGQGSVDAPRELSDWQATRTKP